MQKEFAKIGIKIELFSDFMHITGGNITGGIINSNNDHRIAMASAVAALGAKNKITIENAESINKSYPNFYKDITSS